MDKIKEKVSQKVLDYKVAWQKFISGEDVSVPSADDITDYIDALYQHEVEKLQAEIDRLTLDENGNDGRDLCKKCEANTREEVLAKVIEVVEQMEVPNLPHGHEDFVGYAAGKHDMRQAILKAIRG